MSIEQQLISEIKPFVNNGNLDGLKKKLNEYKEIDFEREIAWEFIFQKIYLHAALKKQKHICEWLDTIFVEFDPIIKIGLRQMFSYANYLLNKK